MSFKDIFKKTFIDTIQNNSLSMANICMTIGLCIVFGICIYWIYFLSQKKGFHNKQMGIVLAGLPIVTAGIVLAMQSNLIVSLGMVGALSIVRFRTAVKEPKDLLFLFWSISTGIIMGAMNYGLALVIGLAVTAVVFLLELLPAGKSTVLLVVNVNERGDEDELINVVKNYVKYPLIKSRNRTMAGTDYIIECKTVKEKELLDAVSALQYVIGSSMIAHDGEAVY